MKYSVKLSALAREQLDAWRKCGNIPALYKLLTIMQELEEHPSSGTGKPERLKGDYSGYWSRRITKADRVVYSINGTEVLVNVISLKGHYSDR